MSWCTAYLPYHVVLPRITAYCGRCRNAWMNCRSSSRRAVIVDSCNGTVPSFARSLVHVFSLSCLLLVGVCCSQKPCSVVLQIIALGGFSGFGFHEVVQVVFPSLGKSSRSPLGVSRFVEFWVPLGCFPGPSLLCFVLRFAARVATSVSTFFCVRRN